MPKLVNYKLVLARALGLACGYLSVTGANTPTMKTVLFDFLASNWGVSSGLSIGIWSKYEACPHLSFSSRATVKALGGTHELMAHGVSARQIM